MSVTLMSSVACASTSGQEGPGEYIDDSVITTRVKAAIINDNKLKVREISVRTTKGVVRLRGYLGSRADVDEAVKVTLAVDGVKSVKNELVVK
jgi:osmotically-inducible protein OsmY